ncbi:Nuclear pore membrane glycoprotein 210 [Triplophysa tibetana]|uniref:Nuclear pore membrane glycoprotein 210 n=1 Tax=Triplophysa tibetana TaxID=1572043 RepID=A0A5A9NE64_9TELE|nr:Nuclear pore membrane glycoprotein 210 [Triplophysa tibetana]
MAKSCSLVEGLAIVLFACSLAQAAKLNIPKVLLPLSRSTKINFTLEATEGCYRWSSNRPEVASIEAVDVNEHQCSQRAVLQARSTQPSRLTSIILAEDISTGQVLRCDAIVDVISEIQIVSTTRELYLEDSPLELKIHALDSEGNTFSTLASLLFDWTIVKDAKTSGFPDSYNSLRVLRFAESAYTPPTYISEMERVGHQGDIILVSGIKTGHAKLKAKIQEAHYKDVGAAEVKLLILENVFLNPAYDVYLLAGTSIKYKVQKIRQGKITELFMPCDQYELNLQNSAVTHDGNPEVPVANLEQSSSTVFAVQHGQTNIVLDHKSLGMQGVSRLPNSTIYVVEPGYLAFKIQPEERWVLETGRTYEIFIEVFDKSGHKIHLSDNIRIETTFPVGYFEVLESSLNGSYHYVKALKNGHTIIDGTLQAIIDQAGNVHLLTVPVRNEQDVEIYNPIVLTPAILTFPWQPKEGAYQYTIKATGGSGNFSWSSTNAAVAMVTVKGLMTTVRDVGVSSIYAHDMRNQLHYGDMKVYVIEPVGMEFSPCAVEARVGLSLELPLRIFGQLNGERVTLSDCSHFDMQVEMDSVGIFQLLEGKFPTGESTPSTFYAVFLSLGNITIGFTYDHRDRGLNYSQTCSTYQPWVKIAIDPVSVVTLGSSKDMIFEGGPRPWVLEPSKFFRNLTAEDHNSVTLSLQGPASRTYSKHLIRATCRSLREQVLAMTVGNQPTVTNPFPAVEPAVVKFVCAPLSRLTLSPIYTSPRLDVSCPLLQQNKQVVPVSNYHNPELDVAAFDHQGRKFDNFSSLSLIWDSSKVSLASIEPTMPMQLYLHEDDVKQKKLHGRQTVLVHRESGIAAITVTAVGYQTSHLEAAAVLRGFDTLSPVSATLDLLLVEDVRVTPNTITIYNHPDVRADLTLREGSGHFYVNASVKGIADVTFQEFQGIAQVVPLQAGVLQVMVHDLCLTFPSPAIATVHIADILEVVVRVVDKVEIGKSVKAYVRVLDGNRKPFQSKYFSVMNLQLRPASSIISLQALSDSLEEDTVTFLVKGLVIGQTSLSATVTDKNGRKMISSLQQIEVFPPFRLLPRKITLIMGAMMQITSEGGPQPQSNILFSLSHENVASINSLGHVQGLSVGNMTVTGVVQAVDTETGKLVVVSQDQVDVEVVQLIAIRIRAPITRMKTETQMPVYVMGLTSTQTPFSFGNALPGLTFHWSVTKRDILDIHTRHTEASLQLTAEHNFAMSVFGRSKGRTGLRVQVKATVPLAGHLQDNALELHDEIQIQVYDKLQLLNPDVQAEEILMSPNSLVKLQTNRDGLGSLSYHVLECPDRTTLIQVDDKGLLTSGSVTGTASLQISSQEAFGVNQTIIIAVKVVTVSYLRVSTSPVMYTSNRETQSAIPLGAVLTFTVHFHDSTGEILNSHNTLLTFSTNREDLVQVGKGSCNSTLIVRTVNVGLTLLAVWDSGQTGLTDYLALPVQHAIHPAEAQQLVVGDVVCFSALLVNKEGVSGVWSSSSSALLEVESRSGVAIARDTGTVTVYYEIAGQLRTFMEVFIESASQTTAMLPSSSVKRERDGKVLIATRDRRSNLIGSCSSSQTDSISSLHPESSISCHVRFTSSAVDFSARDVYHTHTSFDTSTGFYSCLLSLKAMSEQQVKVLSMSMTDVEVTGAVQGSQFSGDHTSVRLPVSPGIYADQTEVILSNQHPSAYLTVYGTAGALQQLNVKSSSSAVTVQEKEFSQSFPSYIKYTVSVVKSQAALTTSLSISSSSSDQLLLIPVTVIHVGSSSMQAQIMDAVDGPSIFQQFIDSYQVMFFTLFALLAATAVVIIVCHALFSPRDSVSHPAFIQKTPPPAGVPKLTESPFNNSMPFGTEPKHSPRLRLYSPNYNSR